MSIHRNDELSRFEQLLATHDRHVLAYALRRVATRQDAEDVTAETFAIAWRRRDRQPVATAQELPWLLAIARRVAANHRRGAQRHLALLDRLRGRPRIDGPSPESPAAEALAAMRAGDQELLRLLAWDGLSQAETGVVLGISENAVAIRLHRARRRFADLLEGIERRDQKGSVEVRTSTLMTGRTTARRTGTDR